ncbi:hypothetical protein EVAR_11959_1 [Eumeta japonica]|uniref:Uncharacterized protein n=1 Tax=Eumeta variegata TaxID=151549 RepID=A0A4C1U532_EUMVA|nr:hypothetical protein EVAR_11959_1 [Eumeta japonica]
MQPSSLKKSFVDSRSPDNTAALDPPPAVTPRPARRGVAAVSREMVKVHPRLTHPVYGVKASSFRPRRGLKVERMRYGGVLIACGGIRRQRLRDADKQQLVSIVRLLKFFFRYFAQTGEVSSPLRAGRAPAPAQRPRRVAAVHVLSAFTYAPIAITAHFRCPDKSQI